MFDRSVNLTAAAPSNGPVRVLVVDDSAVVRRILTRDLAKVPGLEIVPAAPDPYAARERIVRFEPHVLILDVEMPRMDGITFLNLLMRHRPTPTIILSSLTPKGSRNAMDALEAGAIDVLCKPDGAFSVTEMSEQLVEKIRAAARSKVDAITPKGPVTSSPGQVVAAGGAACDTNANAKSLLAIGASTGGVQAVTSVLTRLPADAPATLVVQHMPPGFTAGFASRLNGQCKVDVREAKHGDLVLPGHVLIAPGNQHMILRGDGPIRTVELNTGPAVNHQRPAIDVLFNSIASVAARQTTAAILTGMGNDGAAGLLRIRQAGGRTLAQDEATSVVYGMPAEAVRLGAAMESVPLEQVAAKLLESSRDTRAA